MLIYDGDCGFCTSSAAWIKRRMPEGTEVVPEPGIDAVRWVHDDGRTYRGHRAIARSLIASGGAWRVVGRAFLVPPVSWLAAVVYRVVSANRHRLPGSTDACRTNATRGLRGPSRKSCGSFAGPERRWRRPPPRH